MRKIRKNTFSEIKNNPKYHKKRDVFQTIFYVWIILNTISISLIFRTVKVSTRWTDDITVLQLVQFSADWEFQQYIHILHLCTKVVVLNFYYQSAMKYYIVKEKFIFNVKFYHPYIINTISIFKNRRPFLTLSHHLMLIILISIKFSSALLIIESNIQLGLRYRFRT